MDDRPVTHSRNLTRRRVLVLSALASLSGCLAGMSSSGVGDVEQLAADTERADPQVRDDTLQQLVADNTEFALTLQGELRSESSESNLFASPYSISVALAMTYAGARGKTAAQMRETLRFSLPDEELHPAFNRLTRLIEQGPESEDDKGDPFTMRAVNALWGQRGFPFADAYLDLLATHYGAGLNTVDFANNSDEARAAINAWVADRTEGKIEDLLGPDAVGPRTRLVLTNAIYFLASWANPFDEENTEEWPFDNIDGSTTPVPTMHQQAKLPYTALEGHQAVELPYVGGTASMIVILPAEGEFEAFVRDLDGQRLAEFIEALEPSKGNLALPKFTYETSFNLSGTLSTLGMERAFQPSAADFSGMYDTEAADAELFIQDVIHKAFIAVDEQGTEAAAATGVSVGIISTDPREPWELVVDRPFLFLIRDRKTNAIVFQGTVVDANQLG